MNLQTKVAVSIDHNLLGRSKSSKRTRAGWISTSFGNKS